MNNLLHQFKIQGNFPVVQYDSPVSLTASTQLTPIVHSDQLITTHLIITTLNYTHGKRHVLPQS